MTEDLKRVAIKGDVVRYLRQEKQMTVEELAKQIGIGLGSLSHYERELTDPPRKVAQALAEALGVSYDKITANKPLKTHKAAPRPAEEAGPVQLPLFDIDEAQAIPPAEKSDFLLALEIVQGAMDEYKKFNHTETGAAGYLALARIERELLAGYAFRQKGRNT